MKIAGKLLTFKYEITAAVIAVAFALRFCPGVLTFMSFFWPLFVSTAVVLIGSVVVGKTGATTISADDIPGKSYIEFVVGNHVEIEELVQSCYQKSDH
ncbi:hypothetical protein QQ045_008239 [Rhodiola kirilowii]